MSFYENYIPFHNLNYTAINEKKNVCGIFFSDDEHHLIAQYCQSLSHGGDSTLSSQVDYFNVCYLYMLLFLSSCVL